jgi:hypothetical protein
MCSDDFFDDFDLRDINISGSLDQELRKMEKEARRLERELEIPDEVEDQRDEEEDTPEDFDIEDLIP